ncbi:MAG: hypothetical protein Q8M08_10400 [Bacteroidales bacterium]|nr:hypothetical protein [Bacteroidales bacterium]
MYDEAFSKLLRTVELAVKLRLKELSIDVPEKTTLKVLVDQFQKREPGKNLEITLKNLTDLRNNYMHPKNFSYGGVIFQRPIRQIVIVLNQLFLQESVLIAQQEHLREKQSVCSDFATGNIFLFYAEHLEVAVGFHIQDALFINNEWIYCCVIKPQEVIVTTSEGETVSMNPIFLELVNIEVSKNELTGKVYNTGDRIKVSKLTMTSSQVESSTIHVKSNSDHEHIKSIHSYLNDHEVNEYHTSFLYQYLPKVLI